MIPDRLKVRRIVARGLGAKGETPLTGQATAAYSAATVSGSVTGGRNCSTIAPYLVEGYTPTPWRPPHAHSTPRRNNGATDPEAIEG